MRLIAFACATVALLAAAPCLPAMAADPAAEIIRKVRAAETDDGLCSATEFERADDVAKQQHAINQLLSASDAPALITFASMNNWL